jgi:uncharacterized membrane protein
MAHPYKWTINWKGEFKVKDTNQDAQLYAQMQEEVRKLVNYQTRQQLDETMANLNISDYSFASVDTVLTKVGAVVFRVPWDFIWNGSYWYCNIEGTTTIEFSDQMDPSILQRLSQLIANAFGFLAEHPQLTVTLEVLAIAVVLGVIAFVVITTALTSTVTGVGEAIKTATSTTGGAFSVSVISVVVLCIVLAAVAVVITLSWDHIKAGYNTVRGYFAGRKVSRQDNY